MDDLSKRIEALEKEIKELKSLKKPNSNMFGRSYSQVGDSSSDFLIKTKGQVKVQWGSKFIDLIKDGKINVDSKFIFNGKVGVKDGIYVGDDGSVYLKSGETVINLIGEVGTTYVSFLGKQETTSEEKYTALRNIGFIYPNMSSVDSSSLQNGIIYIESEQKLYIVQDGSLSEFNFKFPNPFTEQFIVQKNDTSLGAILIKGSGIYNSLAFDGLYIFTEDGETYLQSGGVINISVDDTTVINIAKGKTTIKNVVESNTFQSIGADYDNGFMLIMEDGGSTLYVDNLIVRNATDEVKGLAYPTTWSLSNNVITKVEEVSDPGLGNGYALSLLYENQYKVGDQLYVYGAATVDDFCSKIVKVPVEVKALNTETGNIVYVSVLTSLLEEPITEIPDLLGHTTFLIGSDDTSQLIRQSEHNIDLVECSDIQEEQDIASVKGRFGVLDELGLKERDNNAGSEPDISGTGTYSEQGYFDNAGYTTNSTLAEDDNSTRFASTEWVQQLLKEPIKAINEAELGTPTSGGSPIVIAFNGTGWEYLEIPYDLISRLESLETDVQSLKSDVQALKADVQALKAAASA